MLGKKVCIGGLWIFMWGWVLFLEATTMIPYPNLGVLAESSDVVIMARVIHHYDLEKNGQTHLRTRLQVMDNIKGSLLPGQRIDIQKFQKKQGETWMVMWGDIDLTAGHDYLLFLEEREEAVYHPLCYSYYVFEEMEKEGLKYLVPSETAEEFEIINIHHAEAPGVYIREDLLNGLRDHLAGVNYWQKDQYVAFLKPGDFYRDDNSRAAPAGCSFLVAGSKTLRWNIFPDLDVGIHYNQSGAAGCASSVNDAVKAIQSLQSSYPGINVYDAGTVGNIANCADASAVGADYRSYLNTNFGNYRHVVIQFDDPCSEIANLTNCSGILAIGGAYGIGSHDFDGISWATAQFGYVILNNGVGPCRCSSSNPSNINLQKILTHELSHALGLGHIPSSSGSANMNPACCNAISSLDQTCYAYAYPDYSEEALLPVELVSFDAESEVRGNRIHWVTASELAMEKYIIEKSTDEHAGFIPVAEVLSKGDAPGGHHYEWMDEDHWSEAAYYRLSMIGFHGETKLSPIVVISRNSGTANRYEPVFSEEWIVLSNPGKNDLNWRLINMTGQILGSGALKHQDKQYIDKNKLTGGIYFLQISGVDFSRSYKWMHL